MIIPAHSLLLAGVAASALMSGNGGPPPEPDEYPITLVGFASAQANSIEIPEHQPGDLLVISVYKTGLPTEIPLQWFNNSGYYGTNSIRCAWAWKIAESSSEVSGTWLGVTLICVRVYRYVLKVGAWAHINNNGTTAYLAGITLEGDPLTNLLDKWITIKNDYNNVFPEGHTIIDRHITSSGNAQEYLLHSSGAYNAEYTFPSGSNVNNRSFTVELIAYEADKIKQIQLYQQCVYAIIG